MSAAERRIVAAIIVGAIVGGIAIGDSPSWVVNLVRLAIVGGFVGVGAWIVLEGIALALRDAKRSRR